MNLGKICLVLIGLFFLTSNVLWGDELESELIFISADSLIELNWGKNLEWIGPLITEAKTTATKVQSSVDLVFLVQLASDADAKVSIHTRPQVDIVVLNDLKNSINTWKLPRTKFGSFCFEFRFKVKGGTGGDKGNYTPDLIYPDTQFESDFQKLAPEAKYQKMIEYAQKEALPYFRVMMPSVDSKFDGVIQTGKLLEKMNLADALVLPIAVNNKNYWRGIMEMDRSDPSFYVLRAYLEVSEGKLEIANEIQQMARIFPKMY